MSQVPHWSISKNNHLRREFQFENFQQALDFTNEVGEIAEEHGHHPNILLTWGRVVIETITHDADNTVTEKDYKLAESINEIYKTTP